MSTIEQVAQELKNLNEVTDISTELLLDGFSGLNSGNELVVAELKGIREVLNNFMNHVPESIVSGFEKIIVTDRTERENFVVNEKRLQTEMVTLQQLLTNQTNRRALSVRHLQQEEKKISGTCSG